MLIMMLLLAAGAAVAVSEINAIVEEIEDMTDLASSDYPYPEDQTDQMIDAGRDEPPSEEDLARLEALTNLTSNLVSAPATSEAPASENDTPASPLDAALSDAQTSQTIDVAPPQQHQTTDSAAHSQAQDTVAAYAHMALDKDHGETSDHDRL